MRYKFLAIPVETTTPETTSELEPIVNLDHDPNGGEDAQNAGAQNQPQVK